MQQTPAVPGNGGVDHPQLQPKTVPEDRVHAIVAGFLQERDVALVRHRNSLLPVQVSTQKPIQGVTNLPDASNNVCIAHYFSMIFYFFLFKYNNSILSYLFSILELNVFNFKLYFRVL